MGLTSQLTLPVALTFLGFAAVWFAFSTVRSYLRLRNFKGPKFAAFSNLWVFSCTVRGDLNERTAEVLKEHG